MRAFLSLTALGAGSGGGLHKSTGGDPIMPLKWKGDDEHGYVANVDGEELYRVDIVLCAPRDQAKERERKRLYFAGRLEKFYPPIDQSRTLKSIDEAKALCEADYAKQRTQT
jgi:hypothetical protein